ncbi:MAG: ComEA family DNA-binding protein [Candidatus Cloacimonetes bacterium]|nr:ComEA family DNA-binding protein [Candidatus Cloacimonadota bacterium]
MFKNPLRNFLTPSEQKILLFIGAIIILGCCVDFVGVQPLQAIKTEVDSLTQTVQTDVPLRLDIRIAGIEELISLPGIGEKRAQDIISYREQHPFVSVNQLSHVKGIGEKTYAKLLPNLLVFGDSVFVAKQGASTSKQTGKEPKTKSSKSTSTTMVNLNTATLAELCTLAGIGEVKAQAIIDWRKENGNFGSIEDFTKVKGIGVKTLEKNRARLKI